MDNANNANEWLTIKEVSNRTGKTPASIRMLIKRGKIVRIREEHHYGRKYWVIHKDECELLGTQENEDVRTPNSMRTVTEHEISIPFETYDLQRKQWENEKSELIRTYEQGLMMYRFKFEEIDRRLKLLPAPVEVIAHEFEKVKSDLEDKEETLRTTQGELHQVNQALQKLELERRDLENTLQTEQKSREEVISEREALSSEIDRIKGIQGVLEGQKAKLEEEMENLRRDSLETQEQAEKLSHQVEDLTTRNTQAEERAEQLDRERKILEERLKQKEEERRALKAELEEERGRSWWKKLFNLK